jgi:hypothetical protein
MQISARHFVGPLAAIVTLATGIGLVAAVRTAAAFFSTPVAVARASVAEPNTYYDFNSVPRIETPPPPEPSELSCDDPDLLPIWQAVKNDKEFRDRTSNLGATLNCATLLDVKRVDLNRDGNDEFLVRGNDIPLCGGTGNCLFWIFEKRRSKMNLLLAASDYVDMAEMGDQVLKSRTRGYSDILLKGHFTAAETGYYTHRFDGLRYVDSRCMYEVPNHDPRKEGSMEMITCDEFDRRQAAEIAAMNDDK